MQRSEGNAGGANDSREARAGVAQATRQREKRHFPEGKWLTRRFALVHPLAVSAIRAGCLAPQHHHQILEDSINGS
jgi:hypothetical protein